ncbi:sulfite exporter TauE/SafE family protein [Psychrobacter sp. AOP22-C1-22]|uniref:sulfite exporter TauE/SafE family protein n=1 Tax=unclassified Psychrobacter TaxID=196806 RepID=UPI00178886B0|nr:MULTISPECIES: sulfite exporter TauE/SafE family protein [unclassified Psychrobacter]MBE0407075.1 sulfite exporter TauE/SafE family protein [Psychrobacter sp. FME6]MBE0445054.1 sulfite exporter TauE/SafE family protein [Psychrobacter sp. FME5]MDN5800877.1 sulfite exporter TauE/SafE family protein [Psychrobacter sp.]MDN5891106.1 sulfite exporter TauE/SafE family protein [Psychrobacter sp.]
MTIALLVAALLMGFFGSPHCLGMCGGLVTAFGLSMKDVSPTKRRALVATYHLGRLTSYALLGLIAGLVGTTVLAPLMTSNNIPRILLGLVLVFVGVTMLGAPFLTKLERFGMRFWQYLSPIRQKVFPLNTFPRALSAGLLWGFLPCGLVYGALLIAVVAHNPLSGAALMFVFGLGTVPMLVATHETVGWLRDKIGRFRLRQLNGAIMVLSGLAVVFVPIAMSSMHGSHDGGHGEMDHSSHSAMISDTNDSAHHDMSEMDHSMHNMDDDAATMEQQH